MSSILSFYHQYQVEIKQMNWHSGPLTSKLQGELVNFLQAAVNQSVVYLKKEVESPSKRRRNLSLLPLRVFIFAPLVSTLVRVAVHTEFCGGDSDVVPHVRLAVQSFSQRDLPVIHVDVELPLQVCVPVDGVPAEEAGTLDTLSLNCWLFVCFLLALIWAAVGKQ